MERTVELLNASKEQTGTEGKVSAKANLGGKLLGGIIGGNLSGMVVTNADFAATQNRMVKQIIKNTILTDFFDILGKNAEKDPDKAEMGDILKFYDYRLEVKKNMLSYCVVDFLRRNMDKMLLGGEVSVEMPGKNLRYVKGYFEFIGVSKKFSKRIIMRFNISCFRNGYTICDLEQMDLIIYAIKVGSATLDDLKRKENENSDEADAGNSDGIELLDIYDVVLAGVETSVRKE